LILSSVSTQTHHILNKKTKQKQVIKTRDCMKETMYIQKEVSTATQIANVIHKKAIPRLNIKSFDKEQQQQQ
jgi:hypothetical protein